MHAPSTVIDPDLPVPLVSVGEDGLLGRVSMNTLSQAGLGCEKTFTASSLIALANAVAAGFGVMALPRSRAGLPGISIWENAPLPALPDIFCGLYVREGADIEEREALAEAIVAALNPQSQPASLARGKQPSAA